MHELSIAHEICGIVTQYLPDNCGPVKSVRIKVGKLSNVLVDSLQFCFEAITRETVMEGALLQVEEVPVTIKCNHCGDISKIENFSYSCRSCYSTDVKLNSGTEMQVVDIELND